MPGEYKIDHDSQHASHSSSFNLLGGEPYLCSDQEAAAHFKGKWQHMCPEDPVHEHAPRDKSRIAPLSKKCGVRLKSRARRWGHAAWNKVSRGEIDQFAVSPTPPTWLGTCFTIAVWCATIVYLVIIVVRWVNSPPLIASNAFWSIGSGPFEVGLRCLARSGCLVSNNVSPEKTHDASLRVPNQAILQSCIALSYEEELRMPLVYSIDPTEVLSALYDPSTADKGLQGYGLGVADMTRCEDYRKGLNCTLHYQSQVPPGTGTMMYVHFFNNTRNGGGRVRDEFFPHMVDLNGRLDPQTTPCSPDPAWGQAAQTRLRMDSFFFYIAYQHNGFWLILWGTCGGAFGSFVEVAALLMFLWGVVTRAYGRRRARKQLQQMQETFRRLSKQASELSSSKSSNKRSGSHGKHFKGSGASQPV